MHICRTCNLAHVARKPCGMPTRWNCAASHTRELPCFSAHKKMRRARDLKAMSPTALGKFDDAAGFYENDVTFIFHFDENVTVGLCKTKALILMADSTSSEEPSSASCVSRRFSARKARIIFVASPRACCTPKSARGAHDLTTSAV